MPNAIFIFNFKVRFLSILKDILFWEQGVWCYLALLLCKQTTPISVAQNSKYYHCSGACRSWGQSSGHSQVYPGASPADLTWSLPHVSGLAGCRLVGRVASPGTAGLPSVCPLILHQANSSCH